MTGYVLRPPPAGPLDLLVIGGGINGAGIARDAAGRGLEVAVCEQGDFAGATSSASTKLIHGGLRYLEHREFRLVAEALAEREKLLGIAPHIAWPLRFVMPHSPSLRPAWMIRMGLWLYDHLGGRSTLPRSESLRLDAATDAGHPLQPQYRRGFAYSDAWVDDARLVLLNLRSAEAHGAHVLPRTRLVAAERGPGHWVCTLQDTAGGAPRVLLARALVNATGPWVDRVDRLLAAPGSAPAPARSGVKLVRGSHVVLPRLYDGGHAYILQNDDRRIVFMIPYEGRFTLVGTTDVPQADIDAGATCSAEEERYLLRAVNRYLARPVAPADVVWRYAGVRPLFDDEDTDPSALSRDYTLRLDDTQGLPALSVYGGKITTYRRLAEAALERLRPWLHDERGPWTASESLPGGEFLRRERGHELARLQQAYPQLDAAWLAGLFNRHGLLAHTVLAGARTPADLGQDFGGGLVQREVEHLVAHEWARSADDVMWRRTKCGLHMSPAQREAFSAAFDAMGADAFRRATSPSPILSTP
jgi:glycerol-3-phosphate dehydrogenase